MTTWNDAVAVDVADIGRTCRSTRVGRIGATVVAAAGGCSRGHSVSHSEGDHSRGRSEGRSEAGQSMGPCMGSTGRRRWRGKGGRKGERSEKNKLNKCCTATAGAN